VSYLMLSGPIMVFPGLLATYRSASPDRKSQLRYRVMLAGWLLGGICICMFPNVSALSKQLVRHMYKGDMIITPEEDGVVRLRENFFGEIPREKFYGLPFHDQMNLVDDFITRNIDWKSDYSQWYMVGLLLTPKEVIQNNGGDCQGQAAVTTSLLIAMGFKAWMVETPFHWWTHAEDNTTGNAHNLNSHGHGGMLGNVLPQPIDLVFTKSPVECHNCPYMFSHNTDSTFYTAPPHIAIGIAFTGAHIFVRSGMTLNTVNWYQLTGMIVGLTLLVSVYGTLFQFSLSLRSIWMRLPFAFVGSVASLVGMCFWASVLYQVTILHLLFSITFLFWYMSNLQQKDTSFSSNV